MIVDRCKHIIMNSRIKRIIEKNNLSVNQFSKIIGVNRSTMSHILSARNNPSVELLERILDNFSDINPNWLYRGIGPMIINAIRNPDNHIPERTIDKIVIFYSDSSFQELKP